MLVRDIRVSLLDVGEAREEMIKVLERVKEREEILATHVRDLTSLYLKDVQQLKSQVCVYYQKSKRANEALVREREARKYAENLLLKGAVISVSKEEKEKLQHQDNAHKRQLSSDQQSIEHSALRASLHDIRIPVQKTDVSDETSDRIEEQAKKVRELAEDARHGKEEEISPEPPSPRVETTGTKEYE
eukprot:gnl/Carplike_NY0171/9981_a14008_141.p1 GENE.gnl/Carplike_NY0171/9981_a14008_141~~gnl/Carplike_NY0171/9981_a14008_141.p1  ORF type:complete len:188 (-),score=65.55 gnl/Carplike_NY0171/9981_a14008_141:154-717(-)